MKKLKKILTILILTLAIAGVSPVFATTRIKEYTDEYKKYLELTDEEKSKILTPRMFEVKNSKSNYNNPIKYLRNKMTSFESEFQLSQYIPENVIVRNQMQTNSCWAFAALSSLETNLALNNYYNNLPTKTYDFSERHMEYATSRTFLNGVKNPNTTTREVGSGGNDLFAIPYFTNGSGAINESDMPFENNKNKISISKIQNKTVTSQVYDTVLFEASDSEENKNIIKNHVKTYGSVAVGIHGAKVNSEYYNSSTGAIYCDDEENAPCDHEVSIVGWDDNYSRTNFNAKHRPTNNGAWIIKNSWGTTVGKNGFMYVSYEDVNVYTLTYGIIRASDQINYENIYQYDYCGPEAAFTEDELNGTPLYLANIFNKKTSGTEYITQVGIYSTEGYTCRVYVNPNGTGKNKSDLKAVKLKTGDSQTVDTVGYHTLEFLNPMKINADSFVVAIEITGSDSDQVSYATELQLAKSDWADVEIESGKCFITTKRFE